MCGRFARTSTLRELEKIFHTRPAGFEIAPRYSIAPGEELLVVVQDPEGRGLGRRRWGLVPFWAKDPAIGARMINARVETLSAKPAFRTAFRQRRCLIPANGFYEWRGAPGSRQPYYFHLPGGEPLAFAGLYENWEGGESLPGAGTIKSCAIITMEASAAVRDVHHRMPAILKPEAWDAWLDPENTDADRLTALLRTGCVTRLERRPVSKRVNRAGNDTPECLAPLPTADAPKYRVERREAARDGDQ